MKAKHSAKDVASYYDRHTDSYLKTYGRTFQAFRPKDEDKLHDYLIEAAAIEHGHRVLDAGCGVAGPAIAFAQRKRILIDGITISAFQHEQGMKQLNGHCQLVGRVSLNVGDFHRMTDYYDDETFDRILFLESLGHSHNPDKVIRDSYRLLKKGGMIYIKDFYPLQIPDEQKSKRLRDVIDRIDEHYCYSTLDLNQTISSLRQTGFAIDFIKKFGFVDDTSVRSAFELENGLDLYNGSPEFRIAEWLEIRCCKPEFELF